MMDLEHKLYPSVLLGKIRRRLLVYYRRWFCHQNYIFKHAGPFSPADRNDCTFACYRAFSELPESVKAELGKDTDSARLGMDKQEMDENALLWLAFVDGRVASSVFTREGKYFKRWFVGLDPEDLVVFRLSTRPELRGRGLAPSLIVHALHCAAPKGYAYIDCRTYNKPSIRCIKKAGFECIATKKTIKREWALYD